MLKSRFNFRRSAGLFATLFVALQAGAALPTIELQHAFPGVQWDRPLWMSEAPDGSRRFFVVEQAGRIKIIRAGETSSTDFFNIQSREPFASNEEGLLGLAFHPQFKSNQLFYVSYNLQNPRRSLISEFRVSATNANVADLQSERILLTVPQPFWNHKGGQLSFGPDGMLYFVFGDGGSANDPQNNGQNMATLLAKMLRIDVNTRSIAGGGRQRRELPYGIPNDNPWVNEPEKYGVRKEIWATGLRNSWRFSFDRQTGELWLGDVGQDEWEEVNIIVKGGNYGWPVREGFHPFKPGPEGARFTEPVIEYPHRPELASKTQFSKHTIGWSITGGYVYRGKKYPALQGAYVYADYNLGTIWGLRYQNGKVVEQAVLLAQPRNVVSLAEDESGELYVLCFDDKLFKLVVP